MAALVDDSIVNFDNDPYLQYQPAFAYTLPVQLLCAGITLTLLVVLGIHLLFTVQYHYPLAPLNYCLQLSSLTACLISVLIKVITILNSTASNGDDWPYSIVYTAVSIPPPGWSQAGNVMWFFLQALCLGLSNITHIQFLTLLFPSRTEARLIIFVLGPLAIASSGLVFVALANDQKALDVGDAIRNVLNSTLLIIFTSALFLWGLVVNRRRAWRNDGGTSMFGLGSLLLAVVSTSCNIVAVVEDGIDWLQHMLLAAILWQIWLGWWWWVGSGMGIGEVEDIMERAERKKRKSAKRAARQNRQMPKRTRSISLVQLSDAPSNAASVVAGITSSVTGILRNRSMSGRSTLTRRRASQVVATGNPVGDVEEGIEMNNVNITSVDRPTSPIASTSNRRATPSPQQHVEFSSTTGPDGTRPFTSTNTNSETSSTSQTPSLHAPQTVGQFLAFPTTWLQIYLRRLRHAHEDATKKQVIKRAEQRQRVFGSGDSRMAGHATAALPSTNPDVGVEGDTVGNDAIATDNDARPGQARVVLDNGEVGWGLGRFGIAEHEASVRRMRENGAILELPEPSSRRPSRDAGVLAGPSGGAAGGGSRSASMSRENSGSHRRASHPRTTSTQDQQDQQPKSDEITPAPLTAPDSRESAVSGSGNVEGEKEVDNTDWEDMEDSSSSSGETEHHDEAGRNGRRRRRDRDGEGGQAGLGGIWDRMRYWRRTDKSTF